LATIWHREPDWSHGVLVGPLAVCMLWMRRDRFPGGAAGWGWPGLLLVALSVAMRFTAAWYYLDPLDGWSILFWVAGVAWLFGGRRVLWWSLPSIVFLGFMVPLPYRLEIGLTLWLQTIATKFGCGLLHLCGQPAIVEGHTILLGAHRLEVEQACSGVAIFMSIVAMAFVFAAVVRRPWWERVLLLLSVIPVALGVNAVRIAAMGLLCQHVSKEVAGTVGHNAVGWAMIVAAGGLFAAVVWYLKKLFPEVEYVEAEMASPKDAPHD
jgi:exosortase